MTRALTPFELLALKAFVASAEENPFKFLAETTTKESHKSLESFFGWMISRTPWPMELVHMMRAAFVNEGLRKGHKTSDESAFEYAAAAINSKPFAAPAKGGAPAMKDSFGWFTRHQKDGFRGCDEGLRRVVRGEVSKVFSPRRE